MKISVITIGLLSALCVAQADDKPGQNLDPNLTVTKDPAKQFLDPATASRDGSVLGKGTDCPTCKVPKSTGNADCGQNDCRRIKDKKSKKKEQKTTTTE